MSSSRRFSVVRHIQNLHDGLGIPVPFVDYLAGRSAGKYLPRNVSKPIISESRILNMVLEEADRNFARKVADRVNKPADDPGYEQIASYIRQYRTNQYYQEILKLFRTRD